MFKFFQKPKYILTVHLAAILGWHRVHTPSGAAGLIKFLMSMRDFSYRDPRADHNTGSVSPFSCPPSPISHDRHSLGFGLAWPESSPMVPDRCAPTRQAGQNPQHTPNKRDSVFFYPTNPGDYQNSLGGPSFMTRKLASTSAPYPPMAPPQSARHARRSSQQRGDRTPYPQKQRFLDNNSRRFPSKNNRSRSAEDQGNSWYATRNGRLLTSSKMPVKPPHAATSRARPAAPEPRRLPQNKGGRALYRERDQFVGQHTSGVEAEGRQDQGKPKNRSCFCW